MRKLIVVLMAVLMLVSFTSCNQDKIDELEKKVAQNEADKETFTEFVEAFQSVMAVENAYRDIVLNSSSSPITLHYDSSDSTKCIMPEFTGSDLDIWIYQQALLKKPNLIDVEYDKSNTSGTVTYEGTLTKNNFTYKIVNNVIAVKYKLEGSDDWVTEPIKLDINGSLSCKTNSDSKTGTYTATVAFNGTICEKDIDLSFEASVTGANLYKFTAAKINDKDVDLVLLNNVAAGMIPLSMVTNLFHS